jgi:hypothetical protein
VVALILQSAGGALADAAADIAGTTIGTNVMVAGLSFQVFSLTAFTLLCAEFFWRVKGDRKRAAARERACQEAARPSTDIKGYRLFLSDNTPAPFSSLIP